MIIRLAQSGDLAAIAEIWNYYILNTTYNYDWEPKSPSFFEDWFVEKKTTGFPVFVAEEDGELQAYATYGLFRQRQGYCRSAEHGLYFRPELIGKGLGKQLLEVLINDAKSNGFHTFIAGIDSSNTGSIRFHEKMGFTEVARFREVATKYSRWLDCVFMQLIFED